MTDIEQEARAEAERAYPLRDDLTATERTLRIVSQERFVEGYIAGASRPMFARLDATASVTLNTDDLGEPTDLDGNPIRPASHGTREAVTVDDLIETTAGLALANAAWQEGGSAMLRSVNEHESGPWTKPVSPYSAPLLKRLADIREMSE